MKTETELRELFYKNAHDFIEVGYCDTEACMSIDSFIKVMTELNLCNMPFVNNNEATDCTCDIPTADDDNECCRICGNLIHSEVVVCAFCGSANIKVESDGVWCYDCNKWESTK